MGQGEKKQLQYKSASVMMLRGERNTKYQGFMKKKLESNENLCRCAWFTGYIPKRTAMIFKNHLVRMYEIAGDYSGVLQDAPSPARKKLIKLEEEEKKKRERNQTRFLSAVHHFPITFTSDVAIMPHLLFGLSHLK